MHPQPRPFPVQLFLDLCAISPPELPLNFFGQHDSPSNLAESRYLRGRHDMNVVCYTCEGDTVHMCMSHTTYNRHVPCYTCD